MSERDFSPEDGAVPYWNDERVLGRIYFGRADRLVTLRSHIAEERFLGRGSETLFTLSEREGLRTYVQSRFYTQPPVGRPLRLANAQAWCATRSPETGTRRGMGGKEVTP